MSEMHAELSRDVLFGELFNQCNAIEKALSTLEEHLHPCLRRCDSGGCPSEVNKDPEERSPVVQFATKMSVELDSVLAQVDSLCQRVQWPDQ